MLLLRLPVRHLTFASLVVRVVLSAVPIWGENRYDKETLGGCRLCKTNENELIVSVFPPRLFAARAIA